MSMDKVGRLLLDLRITSTFKKIRSRETSQSGEWIPNSEYDLDIRPNFGILEKNTKTATQHLKKYGYP